MGFIFRLITRRALKGNSTFAAISAIIGLVKLGQKVMGTAPKTVYTHKLEAGQVLVVTDAQPEK